VSLRWADVIALGPDVGEHGVMESSVYEAAGGRGAIVALAAAWHRRCLDDPVVSHAFSSGVDPHHLDRLAAYWAESLGGQTDYTETMGDHSHVLRMHAGNGKHEEMDERAQECFALALDDAGLADDERLRTSLAAWFRWATSEMTAYPDSADQVPPGLPLPRWSWDGPLQRT